MQQLASHPVPLYQNRPKDENSPSRGVGRPGRSPLPPGRTELRCTWVHLVPRPFCTIEGVSGNLPTWRAHQLEQTPSGECHGDVDIYRRGVPVQPAGEDALRVAVRVYEPFLACRSRSGRQCPLVTPTDPGRPDYFAAVVVVAPAFLPGRPSTRSWRSPCLAMPTHRRPPAVSIEPLVPGSGSRRRRPTPPSGSSTPAPPPAQRPRPGTPCAYWRSNGSVRPSSLSTARHSPGHHDGVPAGAWYPPLSLSLLRGLPSPHISLVPTVHVAVPHGAETRGSANEAPLPVRRL
ncbi:hypothetical protein MRX96_018162 [Rhipicephalus microplus]